ncbi:MAG: pyridoxamine 5'-phosphate oxidase family protein [Clostridia bacterium]|nr:pyridoxamine 5'-phosphate oxidase family protein [Clostridia bacterium]
MGYFDESLQVMNELYGHDTAMTLATVNGEKANLRVVNAYYKSTAFYITTYGLSNKMREIAVNPHVAINHNLFVAHGLGENLGNPLDENNKDLREELRRVFSAFYDKHVDEEDKNTCILKIKLQDALVFAHDFKYFIDFEKRTATKEKCVVDIVF